MLCSSWVSWHAPISVQCIWNHMKSVFKQATHSPQHARNNRHSFNPTSISSITPKSFQFNTMQYDSTTVLKCNEIVLLRSIQRYMSAPNSETKKHTCVCHCMYLLCHYILQAWSNMSSIFRCNTVAYPQVHSMKCNIIDFLKIWFVKIITVDVEAHVAKYKRCHKSRCSNDCVDTSWLFLCLCLNIVSVTWIRRGELRGVS